MFWAHRDKDELVVKLVWRVKLVAELPVLSGLAPLSNLLCETRQIRHAACKMLSAVRDRERMCSRR
jgi:hypothetical protein